MTKYPVSVHHWGRMTEVRRSDKVSEDETGAGEEMRMSKVLRCVEVGGSVGVGTLGRDVNDGFQQREGMVGWNEGEDSRWIGVG